MNELSHPIRNASKDSDEFVVPSEPLARNSLLIFGRRNFVRVLALKLVTWSWFDGVILLTIVMNSFLMAMNDYDFRRSGGERSWRNELVDTTELWFLAVFTFECGVKILAWGFFLERHTYLRDPWNVLDFFVVVFGWIGRLPGVANLTALRALRILRPLRSVNAVKGMKILVRSLLASLPGLANVAMFMAFMYIVFSIIGLNSFRGIYYQRCRFTKAPVDGSWPADESILRTCELDGLGLHSCPSERTCGLPSDYELFDPSFQTETEIEEFNWGITSYDNIAISMLTTFQISTLEGWTSIVYSYSDANMPPFVMFFFAVLVIYVGFFLLNLVLAAIWTSFTKIVNQEKQDEEVGQRRRYRENTSMLMASVARNQKGDSIIGSSTQNPSLLYDDSKQAAIGSELKTVVSPKQVQHSSGLALMPEVESEEVRSNSISEREDALEAAFYDKDEDFSSEREQARPTHSKLGRLVESVRFQIFIITCIILNTAFLAMDRYQISNRELKAIEIANLIFYSVFVIEMGMKLVGLGVRGYLSSRWNVFDGVIVVLSTMELVLFYSGGDVGFSSGGAISAFRAFRLLRALRLARSWVSLRKLLNTIALAFSSMGYFTILTLLFFFIYALLGMELFAHFIKFEGVSPRQNFDDFLHAFIAVFSVTMGDDWQYMMYDSIRTQGYAISIVYFISLIIVAKFILLNLLIAILLGNFEDEN